MKNEEINIEKQILEELKETGAISIEDFARHMQEVKNLDSTFIYMTIRQMLGTGVIERNEVCFYNHMIIKCSNVQDDIDTVDGIIKAKFGGSLCFMITSYLKYHGISDEEYKEFTEIFLLNKYLKTLRT